MNDHVIGCECMDCVLDAWSMPDSSKRFRNAAIEIRRLRALVDEQVQAMNNGPMGDLNYAGVDWLHRAKQAREPVEYPSSPQDTPLDSAICAACGKPFEDYVHNIPEGRDDFANHEFVGSEVKPRTQPKWFTYEDQLPADMPKEDYAAWYAKSWILGGLGVRVGPVYPSDAEPRTGEGS